MERLRAVLGFFVVVGFLGMVCFGCSGDSSTTSISTNRVYLMSADEGSLTPTDQSWEHTLTLENVSDEVLWYTDRPGRESGTETMGYFVQTVWPEVYVEIAPNAILDGWIPPNVSNDGLFLILRTPVYYSETKQLTFNVTLENSTMDDKHPESAVIFEDVKITVLNNSEDAETDIYSFVQVSPTAYFEETGTEGVYKLYLNDVCPESFYLQDAPGCFSFVYPTGLFDLAWPNLFGDNPPNASMTSYTDSGELEVQIVTLDNPDYDEAGNVLTYTATLLHGNIENNQSLISPTLFIDAQVSPSCDKQMGKAGFTKRLTFLNSCYDDAYLVLTKGGMPEQWDFWKTTSGSTPYGNLQEISPLLKGKPYHYCIPDAGAPSGNFSVNLKPCKDDTGDECIIGSKDGDRSGVKTLFEPTFGCIPGTTPCAKNPSNGKDLTPVDWFDVSAVSGYTVPIYMEVTNAQKLTCPDGSSSDGSMMDLASCPAENKKLEDGGYGTTMVAVKDTTGMGSCVKDTTDPTGKTYRCTGTGFTPCKTDADCEFGNTKLREFLTEGFSLLTEGKVGETTGYQACAPPIDYLSDLTLGNPQKNWMNPSKLLNGTMSPTGWPLDTLPVNTASWYGCVNAKGPGKGPAECDKGPTGDGKYSISMTGYVRRLKELGVDGYAWQFDDSGGLHTCNLKSKELSPQFLVTICPGKTTGALYPWSLGGKPYSKERSWNWTNGKCTAVNTTKGTYKALYECQRANLKYTCAPKKITGTDPRNYCVPVGPGETGGVSYEECYKNCYNK